MTSTSFQLATGEVHCWCASLDVQPVTFDRLYSTLTPDERRRSARFRFERDHQRFVAARGMLRELLARYLQSRPDDVRFTYTAFGKPALHPKFGSRLTFNLSHSGGLALVAIATTSQVGVDLERIQAQSAWADIARRFFSASEIDQLAALPTHLYTEAFYSCWVKKEACLKACGEGLSGPLNGFSVPLTTDPGLVAEDLLGCALYALRPAPGYAGALAIEGSGWHVSQRRTDANNLVDAVDGLEAC